MGWEEGRVAPVGQEEGPSSYAGMVKVLLLYV